MGWSRGQQGTVTETKQGSQSGTVPLLTVLRCGVGVSHVPFQCARLEPRFPPLQRASHPLLSECVHISFLSSVSPFKDYSQGFRGQGRCILQQPQAITASYKGCLLKVPGHQPAKTGGDTKGDVRDARLWGWDIHEGAA